MAKSGYVRGQAEDGGWFYTYKKSFTGLNLEAIIEFSGNGLPEENREVALIKLYFVKTSDEPAYTYQNHALPLSDIPPVLLSECWNDLKTASKAGTGYDKDWQKKVY